MTCNRDQISHIVYGIMCAETKYSLSGKMTKPLWYVDVNVLTYGYSYNAKASGTAYDTNYKITLKYKNNNNKMNCLIPSYKLSYDIETINRTNYLEISWFVGSQFLGAGGTTPPETGIVYDQSYLKDFMLCFMGLLILVRSKKRLFNK